MGIDARLETEHAESLAEIPDPRNHFSWGLNFHDPDATACLRFIDSYGNTIFNQIQLPVLLSELRTVRDHLTEGRFRAVKEQYLTRAASWPEAAHGGR